MKKIFLLLALMLCVSQFSYAQWIANGANINNTNTGFVGIGTTTPAYPLDINGTLRVTNGIVSPLINKLYMGYLGTDTNSLVIGKYGSGLSSTGGYNIAIGPNALSANTTGLSNVGIGYQALLSNTTGASSIAIGPAALFSNTIGSRNVALGSGTMRLNTSGSNNVAIGIRAGFNLSSGSYNTLSGSLAGSSITTGSNNTILGAMSGASTYPPGITTGSNNTVIGAINGLAPDLSNHIILGDGSGNQRLVIDQNGYTGIGTTTPNERLEVAGAVVLGGTTANLDGANLGFVSNQSARLVIGTNRTGYEGEFDFIANKGSGNNGGFAFYQHDDDGTERELIKLKGNGYIGIGMTNPDEKLSVNGTVHAKEVRVDLTGWPDYVFKSQFKLTPLSEVKTYIDQNQHLPGIPSAEQVAKEGVNIGEMNAKLLKKIEELTLYLIEKDKKDQELQAQVDELKKQLLALSKTK